MLLDQAGEPSPVHIPSTHKHVLCPACGGVKKQVRQRKGMPAAMVAPNPYDVPVKIDPSAQALIDKGKTHVKAARARAKRAEFAERASRWDADRIREEMGKINDAIKGHEDKIAECLRQMMILEDQLAILTAPVVQPGSAIQKVATLNPSQPFDDSEPAVDPCPF
jgi:hypothetical protein